MTILGIVRGATKLSGSAHFEEFEMFTNKDFGDEHTAIGKLWIINNEMIIQTSYEDLVNSNKPKITIVVYFTFDRDDSKADYTGVSNVRFNVDKTYGFTLDDETIQTLKDYGISIEKDKVYPLEKWFEAGVNPFTDYFSSAITKGVSKIQKISEDGTVVTIDGITKTGVKYSDSKIPAEYKEYPVLPARKSYSGNSYYKPFPTMFFDALFDDALPNKLWIFSKNMIFFINLKEITQDKLDINIVIDFSIERTNDKITKCQLNLDRTYGFISDQHTIDFMNSTFDRLYELNKIYNYEEWTKPEDVLTDLIKDTKGHYEKYANTFLNRQIYERNGKIYIDGIALFGEKYDSNKLPDDFGPTLSPVGPSSSSHIVINIFILMIITLLLL